MSTNAHGETSLLETKEYLDGSDVQTESQESVNPSTSETIEKALEACLDENGNRALRSTHDDLVYRYLAFDETAIYPQGMCKSDDLYPTQGIAEPNLRKFNSPYQWPEARKQVHLLLSCAGTLIAAYAPGAYLAGAQQLESEFNQSVTAISAGLTIFTGCFAIAPMFLAPLSEIAGRKPVFTVSGIIFVICQLGTGLSNSYAGIMISRAIGGAASSVFSSMVVGVLSDIYTAKDRNTPMIAFSATTLAASGLGPGISNIMVQYVSWRWTWYLQTITCGLTVLAQAIFFKETRGSVLLSRKAQTLNSWYDKLEAAGDRGLEEFTESGKRVRIRWKVKSDEERASILTMIRISLVRPFHLLLTESIVFWFSFWVAFAWMILYASFASVPFLFITNHGFDSQAVGLVFFSIVVSSILFGIVCIWQEKLGDHYPRLRFREDVPESRLYFACIQSVLFPIGTFWLAWTQFGYIHWMVPTLAIGVMNMGIFSVYLAGFSYLTDTYNIYASSAVAAQSFCRNVLGATIPLYIDQMLERMTFQGGLSFLGGVGVLLTFVPWALVIWGPAIRARSPIAKSLSEER